MLMPVDPRGRSEGMEWLFAALNSVAGAKRSARVAPAMRPRARSGARQVLGWVLTLKG
jgi:hypothetical protein